MINRICFSNYKAFDYGDFELTPITLLIGANSAGKSSLLQLILLFAQSFQSTDDYAGAFKLNSKYVSLGEGINILRDKSQSNELHVRFNFKPISLSLKEKIIETFMEYAFVISRFGANKNGDESPIYKLAEQATKNPSILGDLLLELNKEFRELEKSAEFKKTGTSNGLNKFFNKTKLKELSDLVAMCNGVAPNLSIDGVGYNFYFEERSGEIHVKKISVYCEEKELISFSNRRQNGYSANDLSSDFFDASVLERYRSQFGRKRNIDGFRLSSIDPQRRRSFFGTEIISSVEGILEYIFETSTSAVESSFKAGLINHVSPLRAFPQRYYMIDQSYTRESLNTKEGDSLADALKRNPEIKKNVNEWLNKFNLNVDVEALKDIIHSIKINQNDLQLDLTDVGFGISQVLPVIVQGFLSKPSSITIIEQPEIHLHPKMQAELADLFIDITKSSRKSLVIETHSEALLKRLRRRISEGAISSSDVSIYFIHGKDSENSNARLRKIEIGATGAFDWPKDFTETEIEDSIAFMKNQ